MKCKRGQHKHKKAGWRAQSTVTWQARSRRFRQPKTANTPGPSWWVGLTREQHAAMVAQKEQERQAREQAINYAGSVAGQL